MLVIFGILFSKLRRKSIFTKSSVPSHRVSKYCKYIYIENFFTFIEAASLSSIFTKFSVPILYFDILFQSK